MTEILRRFSHDVPAQSRRWATTGAGRLSWPILWFRRQTLAFQFLLASSFLILLAAAIGGQLIVRVVSANAASARAASTALFMQSVLEPAGRELQTGRQLSEPLMGRLDAFFAEQQFKDRFPYFELWLPDGTVAYSTSKEIVGRRFHPPSGLVRALRGDVVAEYTDLSASEHTLRYLNERYLEIYSPLRIAQSGAVVAVAEIHEDSEILHSEIFAIQLSSWAIVAGASGLTILGLFSIVRRGNVTIEQQRLRLELRAAEAERVSEEIRILRDRVRRASMQMTDFNERLNRDVGADLHDGPAQLIGFAILQLEPARRARSRAALEQALDAVGGTLDEALKEVRLIARSLLLPDIEQLGLDDVIARAVKLYAARTGNHVAVQAGGSTMALPPVIKTCVFRFVQEGLNNAHRHAAGHSQTIRCQVDGATLTLSVCDHGDAPVAEPSEPQGDGGLGIHGLRQRLESLGGTLRFVRRANGAELTMVLDLGGGLLDA